MQDHASHWTHLAPLDGTSRHARPRRALLPRLKRAAAGWPSSPMLTGVILLASTLCAAGTFVWMLPSAGRATPYPPHAVAAPPAPAAAPRVAPTVRAQPLALPRMITRFAVAAGHTLARARDGRAFAAAHSPAPAPAPNAAAGVVAPSSDRIVYLVDASGSLVDSLPRVVEWLGESLDGLKRSQRFTVLFFREGQVFEVPPAGLKGGNFASKAAVWGWMQPDAGNVLPQGRSDLNLALRAAMQYHPLEIVLLSDDSLARRGSGDESILSDVADSLQGRDVNIHTVQFFYRDEAGALEAIADCFDGQYDFIAPDKPDLSAEIDPLLAPLIN